MAQNVAANATVSEGVVTNPVEENVNEVDNASTIFRIKTLLRS